METKHIWAGLGEEERVQLLEMSWDLSQGSAVVESPDSAIPWTLGDINISHILKNTS